MAAEIEITMLREVCTDKRTCPSISSINGAPGRRFVVAKRVVDSAILAAYADRIGDDEILGEYPAELTPEV